MPNNTDPLADLHRANAELAAARKAALNLMEDAILARDALRASEARKAFLLKLSDVLRPLADPREVKAAAARVLGEHLRVNRAFYAEVEGDDWLVVRGYEQGVAPLPDGPYSAGTYGHWVMQTYRAGGRIVFRDTGTDPRFAPAERDAHAAAGIVGAVGVPLVKKGTLVAILAVHTAGPRDWTDAEIGLVEETAERTWASVQRAVAEAALAEEKEYAESIVETLHEPLLVLHSDLTVKGVNPAFYTHFRVNPADTVGRKVYELGNGQWDIPALRAVLEEVLPDSNVFNDYEVTHEFEGLGRRVMLVNGRRLDHVQLILLGIRDITERAAAEAALRASEQRYRALVESQAEMICRFRPDGTILLVNEAYARTFGRTAAELAGTQFWDLIPPEDHADVRAGLGALTRDAPQAQIENRIASADGPRWALWTNRALEFDGSGRVVEAQSVGVDITDRKLAEEGVQKAEERLRLALAAARMGIWTLDADTGTQTRDANLNALLGLEAVETAQPFAELLDHIHPDDRAGVEAAFARSVHDHQPLKIEFRVVRPDGAVRWLRDQGDVFHTAGAQLLAGACVDITELKEVEGAVRAGEERLRLVVESATDYAIFTLDSDRTVTSWSTGAAAVFGYAAEEMTGRAADVVFTPEDRAAGAPEQEARTARRDGRAADERWHLRKDGSRFFASGVLTLLGEGDRGFVKILRDLTGRKRMEEELERRVQERTTELAAAVDALETEVERRRGLARRLATAQEDERRRVARDLHDTVGQLMAGLGLAVAAARRVPDLPPAAEERLAAVQHLADTLARETHTLAVRLRPTALDDLGLEPALRQLVTDWFGHTGVGVDFETAGLNGERLPPEVETAVYRMVQEALTNVTRHAQATRVGVSVGRTGEAVTVIVEDDGVGFDPATAGAGRLGLVSMRERVDLAGGTLEIESGPHAGTTLIARFP